MTASIKNYFPYLLPLLLIFSRSLADITIVLIGILFLYHSYKNIGWEWVKEKWFCFALIFTIYCLTINSAMSIEPSETLAYSLFFIRWPMFAMALSYWILNDIQLLKKFLWYTSKSLWSSSLYCYFYYMDKEFFIYLFLGLITLLFIMNHFSILLIKVSQEKKNKYRTIFNYFYGLLFLFIGVRKIYFNENIYLGVFFAVFSITFLILNFLGKFNPKSS